MLSAPSGNPAAVASSAIRSSDRQASSAGFTTQALPAASAPPTRAAEDLQRIVPRNDVPGDAVRLAPGQHRVALGIRQRLAVELVAGARRRTRSSGRRRRRRRAPASSACRSRAPRAARARRRGRRSRGTARASLRPLSAGDSRPQAPSNATRAARTAASMSGAPPRAIDANGLPSDGSSIGSVSPRTGGTKRPPMKCCAVVRTASAGVAPDTAAAASDGVAGGRAVTSWARTCARACTRRPAADR